MSSSLRTRAAVEAIGTAFLLIAVVGSGIMAERLAAGNLAITLLANSAATGAALIALTLACGPLSGGHFNPAVTATDAFLGGRPWAEVPIYALAQITGAFAGVACAHAMFENPVFSPARRIRAGAPLVFAETVATFGLLAVVFTPPRRSPRSAAVAVGCYIAAAYWFTSSTSFANPAVTLARSMTDTFTGIRPQDVPGFLLGQALGAAVFAVMVRSLKHARRGEAP